MFETVRRTIQSHRLIPPDSKLVIGVSGGADSLALLYALHRLSQTAGYQLHVATFDHQLRGAASADDAVFVQDIAHSLAVPVTAGAGDVSGLAQRQGVSIEVAARHARYAFLADVARQINAERIAVAHHADDQAETVLMHLVRGAGTRGLSGMAYQAPVPEHPDLILIRPLLDVSRAQIEAFCQEHGLTPREDATNQDTTLLRNHLRWRLLPQLRELNPHIQRALVHLADISRLDQEFLDLQLQAVARGLSVSVTPGRSLIARDTFGQLHPALQRRWVEWAAQHVAGHLDSLSYSHIAEAVEVALRGRLGALALLTGGVRLRVDYDTVVVETEAAPTADPDYPLFAGEARIVVQLPGITPLGRWQLEAALSAIVNAQACLAIPATSVVELRTRQAGDRFAPFGLSGHTQKVNRWMINRKIPQAIRHRIPMLCVDAQIAAIIVGADWIIDEHYAVTDPAQRVVYFRFLQNP